MITQEERQEIIDAAVEKALLSLPTVMGNLMAQQAVYSKLNSEFYKAHPEFVGHKGVVSSIVEKIDGLNPLLSYDEKLKKAVPEIEQAIRSMKGVDTTSVNTSPNRSFGGSSLVAQRPTDNGEL